MSCLNFLRTLQRLNLMLLLVCNLGDVSPCEHGGSCVNTPGSFICDCALGFTGPRCEMNINECASHPCLNDGTCLDEIGRFRCICMEGTFLKVSLVYLLNGIMCLWYLYLKIRLIFQAEVLTHSYIYTNSF